MDASAIAQFADYTPLAIFLAAVFDVFFVTGYILYGFAMAGVIVALHASHMISTEGILTAAFFGTMLGNQINYWAGRLFGTAPFIKRTIEKPQAQKAVGFLRTRGLFVYILISRFVTFIRPIHAVILGVFNINYWRFLLYDIIVSLFWVTFWLILLLMGEDILVTIAAYIKSI